eukprot:scaffold5637_cov121-Isochrysis_galbana.AAC.1
MGPGSETNSRQSQTQTPRGVTVGTLKRGPPLRVRGDRGQPAGAPPPPLYVEATHTAPPHA